MFEDPEICTLQPETGTCGSNIWKPHFSEGKVASNTTAGYVIMYIQNDVMMFKKTSFSPNRHKTAKACPRILCTA